MQIIYRPGARVRIASTFRTRKGHKSKLAGAVGVVLNTEPDGLIAVQAGVYKTHVPADKLTPSDEAIPQNSINHRYGIRSEKERALVQSCDGGARISAGTSRVLCDGGYEAMQAVRPGSEDHRRHPSLIGGMRVWLDGRMEAAV